MKHPIMILLALIGLSTGVRAQKKPLDHSVYDEWESLSQVLISNDGRYAACQVTPQAGDSTLYVTQLKSQATTRIDRGYGAQITDDSQYIVFRIRPTQAEKKAAHKKQTKAGEMPKDSLGWLPLGSDRIVKIPQLKTFRIPEKASDYVAFTTPMPKDTAKPDEKPDYLLIYYFRSNTCDTIPYVSQYVVSKNGRYLSYATRPASRDSAACPGVFLYDAKTRTRTTLMEEPTADYKLQTFDEEATQFAFFAATDTTKRDPKVYNLYHTQTATPTLRLLADTLSAAMPENWAVNTSRTLSFSYDGQKLYFGISPLSAPKDTTVDESEQATLDLWHYRDDYIQPMQLKQLQNELNRSYLCVCHLSTPHTFIQLAAPDLENITTADRGNSEYAVGTTTQGYRIEAQWLGSTRNDVCIVSTQTGERTPVANALNATPSLSTTGRYLTWFDRDQAQWYLYSVKQKTTHCATEGLDTHFEDASGQTPDRHAPFGLMGWSKDDRYLYVYDKYDIWQIDPTGQTPPSMITKGTGRREKITFRLIKFDSETPYIETDKPLFLSAFNNETKEAGYYTLQIGKSLLLRNHVMAQKTFPLIRKAKHQPVYVYTKADFRTPPDLWVTTDLWKSEKQLSRINPRMKDYLWGDAELVAWKSKDGFDLKGILYKPENFDPNRKYPMIIYFYEKHSDELYRHFIPALSRSTINIPFYCSRGYLVFTPDVYYTDGHPGRSAYNSVVAGVEVLCENPWVDKTRIGIQGQSWGGYQVAYLVTRTDLFAAAGAGAPVANMTSAYGGIRWSTGTSRQRQYERQQSRIGKTLWDGLDLYIENSPLFYADRVKTPLLMMHNDRDGAVPWYQGIEFYLALRRLGKEVYFLQYNGEEHNLVQRRNMRDLTIRMQQFFDHYLQGAPKPVWMKEGIPATRKGKTWGLETH
jgi:dipeptidyl aminopeptidase/acylaminoacyl peptidase